MANYLEVCGFFITTPSEDAEDTRLLKLMKLVYITHGFFLAIKGSSFIKKDHFQAWVYGPVLPELYDEYKTLKHDGFVSSAKGVSLQFDATDQSILGIVHKRYSCLEAFELVGLTHKVGSPWHSYYDGRYSNRVIPDQCIKEYYENLLEI